MKKFHVRGEVFISTGGFNRTTDMVYEAEHARAAAEKALNSCLDGWREGRWMCGSPEVAEYNPVAVAESFRVFYHVPDSQCIIEIRGHAQCGLDNKGFVAFYYSRDLSKRWASSDQLFPDHSERIFPWEEPIVWSAADAFLHEHLDKIMEQVHAKHR